MKKIIVFCAVLVLALSACAQTPKPIVFTKPEKGVFDAPTGNVTSPDSLDTWTQNNLTFIRPDQPTESAKGTTKIYTNSLQIDGLKDNDIEAKINQSIAAKIQELTKYAEFKNLPVSPGFYAKYPKDTSTVKSINIYPDEYFNCNNLLSLRFYTSVIISEKLPDNMYDDFTLYDAMTIDLNTGNEIHLSDLFINGFKFEKALNTAVLLDASGKTDESDDLYFTSYIYRGGFSGIRSDIGFFLYSYNGLNLIFDPTYYEFDNGFSSTIIEIPFASLQDGLAFGQRFLSKDSLFTNSKVTKENNYLYVSDVETTNYSLNGIPVTSTVTINRQIKGSWLALTKSWVIEDKKTLETISMKSLKGISYDLTAQPVGQYMRISRKFRSWTVHDVPDNIEKSYMVRADGSILTLKDLFKPGYDYETPIKKALAEFLKAEYVPDEEGIPSIDDAYKNLNFVLGYQWFSLYNTGLVPPVLQNGQIDLSFRIADFKGNINEEVLLK
ncbi:MAG: hypothetical protein WBL80_06975 [Erysipelotrichaceae bacterium]